MTGIENLLISLAQKGFQIWAENGELRISAPRGALTAELRAALTEHKAEAVTWLSAHGKIAPTTYAQERLWFLDQLDPGNTAYHILDAKRLSGELDMAALEKSLDEVTRRHQSLRTAFASADGQPIQVIHPYRPAQFSANDGENHSGRIFFDLSTFAEAERQVKADRLVSEATLMPFDLARGHLFRVTLLRLSKQEHILVLVIHHIISDGWSHGILTSEITSLYDAFRRGQPSPLPELKLQYTDFAVRQRQWLQGEQFDAHIEHWKQRLTDVAVLQLPTDHPRSATLTHPVSMYYATLPEDLTRALRQLIHSEGGTLFMVLLAAFKILLYRYTNQTDICVGTFVANRNQAEIENLIGFFINNLALRTDLSGNPTVRQLLNQVKDVTLEAYAHQDLPFEKVIEAVQPKRSLNHSPLFQVMCVMQNFPSSTYEISGLTFSSLETRKTESDFDLTLWLYEGPQGVTAVFGYNQDLFEATTIERMAGHFRRLLEGMAADAQQSISDLEMLTSAEQQQLTGRNQPARVKPAPQLLHERFAAQARQTPNAAAVEYEEQRLTYATLDNRSSILANRLREMGVGPGSLVGLYLERSLDVVIGFLGVLKAGGAYVPLDPHYPRERLAFMLADCHASVLLTQQALLAELPEHQAQVICLDTIPWDETAPQDSVTLPASHRPPAPEDLAYVIYTSGSTGQPKGVCVTHHSLMSYLAAVRSFLDLRADDRMLQFASHSFDATTEELYPALLCGATVVLRPSHLMAPGAEFTQLLSDKKLTVLSLPVAFWHEWVLELDHSHQAIPTDLRMLLLNAEEPAAEKFALWQTLGGSRVRWINTYGPTETTVTATLFEPLSEAEKTKIWTKLPIGRPLDNTKVYVLDQHMQLVPIGVPGELYIGGEGVTDGYLNRPDLTAERFIPDPFSAIPGKRLYKTGDRVRYLPDGNLEFLERVDFQVKIRGYRVELGEIEAWLNHQPGIRQATVLARQENTRQKQLVAYLVPETVVDENSASAAIHELRQAMKTALPEYMLPAAFVFLETLPLTPNGKVDRGALPAPSDEAFGNTQGYVAPRAVGEELLAGIWTQVLGLNQIGVQDNFFEAGGHSLLATQVTSRIREIFRVELPLRELFKAPTIAELTAVIEKARRSDQLPSRPPIQPTPRSGKLPLSFAQQRLWFLDQYDPDSATYNIPISCRLIGTLDVAALERSINIIIERHESLRTTFAIENGIPTQIIAPSLCFSLHLRDLSTLPENVRETEMQCLADADAQQPFDLVHGPLFRFTLLRLDIENHLLLLNIHHIVSDGWSTGILFRELGELYRAQRAGESPNLPDLTIQYPDFAAWQRNWLQGDTLQTQLDYWRNQLSGAPSLLELPTDRPRPAQQTHTGATLPFNLSPDLVERLQALSQNSGATLFMTLLAAFDVLLHRYSGQDDIVVGAPIANRNQSETEALIGFFVNTIALRADLSGNPSFRQLLGRVRETALDAYTHQDLPFEKLVEELQPERSLSYAPVFQVTFALQNLAARPFVLPGLQVQFLATQNRTAKFDLSLSLQEHPQGLVGWLEYNTDLFDEATIERLAGHFQTLLESIVANPEQFIDSLHLLTPAETRQLLVDWNDTQQSYSTGACFHNLFEAQAEKTPEAIAVVFEDQQLTYAKLNAHANQLAHYLRNQGVGPEVLVGICVERSFEMLVGLLGILKAGGAYLPLDPAYPRERLAYVMHDANISVLLTQERLLGSLPTHTAHAICLDKDWQALISAQSLSNPISGVESDNLAYVIYTSGSTGKPKGTMALHRGLVNYLIWCQQSYPLRGGQGTPIHSSISFDLTITGLFAPLIVGQSVHMLPENLSFETLSTALNAGKDFSLVKITPAHLKLLGEQLPPEQATDCTRAFIIGGESLQPTHLGFWCTNAPNTLLINEYGPTETVVGCCVYVIQPSENLSSVIPIGRPIVNTQIYILDRSLNPVPVGVAGELHIAGDGVTRGYLNCPDLTAEKFIPNPFSGFPGARMYKSGDLARYLPDGNIECLGRIDHQVKLRGYRIELGEIESALESHPLVEKAIVLLSEDQPGDQRLVGYVVPKEGGQPDGNSLRTFLKDSLPEYMLPSAWVFLDRLPLTPNGKVDRKALRTLKYALAEPGEAFVAPSTPFEEILAEIWSEVLDVERIGIHDNFFGLGGHSLLAIKVLARMRDRFEIDLPVRHIFEAPTIAELALRVEQALIADIRATQSD